MHNQAKNRKSRNKKSTRRKEMPFLSDIENKKGEG